MADLFGEWVPDEWIEEVFKACAAAPRHRYMFLTKNPKRYHELMKNGCLPLESNYWYGFSAETNEVNISPRRVHAYARRESNVTGQTSPASRRFWAGRKQAYGRPRPLDRLTFSNPCVSA
jgi:protein gp37